MKYNIVSKAALKYRSEIWVLNRRDEQRLEASQMKFLRQLLRITKLHRERNETIRENLGFKTLYQK